MNEIVFLVIGTSREPYEVTFVREKKGLSAYCTCPAGTRGQYCKHRFEILKGDSRRSITGNKEEVDIVTWWLRGTEVEAAMSELEVAEGAYNMAKREFSAAKRELARVMN